MRISDWSSDVCSSDLQGADFSPIGHWSQGLARVAQGLFGGMRERRADKASEANAAESNAVLQALMGQQSGATGTAGAGNPQAPDSRSAIIAALSNPYLSDDVRKFAGQEYQRRSDEHTSELQSIMRISN